jgi:hypothetical protein
MEECKIPAKGEGINVLAPTEGFSVPRPAIFQRRGVLHFD